MAAELVYSTNNIKFHGGIIKDKQGKLIKRTVPFEISERLIENNKAILKSRKVIIRNGKSKIVEDTSLCCSSPEYKGDATTKALIKLNALFESKFEAAKKDSSVQIGDEIINV